MVAAVVVAEAAAEVSRSSELCLWQALALADLPAAKCGRLWAELKGTAEPVVSLKSHPALAKPELERIGAGSPSWMDTVERLHIGLVLEDRFPAQLFQAPGRTPALFVVGDWAAVQKPTIGIVGTRGASPYGRAAAYKFAEAFARAGVTVVSGGALGIDAEAHRGALAAGGQTVAVLSGGVDRIYPRVHASLFSDISANGCLVSQFAVGERPDPYRFLTRNKLIAALSLALLVIEAPERSGALSTSTAANELGRSVYVVPANIDAETFRGSHALIRDGATLVDHPDQILEDLHLAPVESSRGAVKDLSEIAQKIMQVLTVNPMNAEKISETTSLSPSDVLSELTILEMDGIVVRQSGGYAVRL